MHEEFESNKVIVQMSEDYYSKSLERKGLRALKSYYRKEHVVKEMKA
eukprot:CAMPEP_0170566764 /NCGR_PEP_ID=MMETSP0211-20121228/80045_1 /TAXON_ID=311385 /ORGANISM="Pseudokeronopsis sp., Strain OXSARD2" /LENGTH=46 /DNA_ID= /DNA_START= /DNA_END= /DNA_ORIENTATION=